ncbi:hypothetical protein RvY_11359 [Ramazzottius varieornatus]|uniref:non-specific serine/threonine protein kinase n=1 Tax=Ramazzottius varieornatus TaxID=947166 RepID=A0A1D1VIA4_RAMVA|nr:hypothetical protein RvY_11359 [Ramazzottius varieornatus]
MSMKQVLVSLNRQVARVKLVNALRQPPGRIFCLPPPTQIAQVIQSTVQPVSYSAGSSFLSSLRDLTRRTLFPIAVPRMPGWMHRVARSYARPVAPLLGFIAAFLQESKTEEFRTNAAFVAVHAEANEFSKKSMAHFLPKRDFSDLLSVSELEFGRPLGKGCNAAVYEARMRSYFEPEKPYDLAVKVLFNYSNNADADEVAQFFETELLPSRFRHLSIVDVFRSVVDLIPELPQSSELFPGALPQKYNNEGLGANHTMFVLMNKYSGTLRDRLLTHGRCGYREGLTIFSQLLEGVVKLGKENVAHRDIKSDNILLANSEDGEVLRAVVSDFGCSLNSLRLHYFSSHISKGGNRALMAPEVVNAKPGILSFIDYGRSDLWAVGTIAYEIFKGFNPFFEGVFKLDSGTYDDSQLLDITEGHEFLNRLVRRVLRRDYRQRPSPAVAATACYMLLWDFPLGDKEQVLTLEMIRLWIMQLCVKLICESRENAVQRALLGTFLRRCNVADITEAWRVLTTV